MEFSVFVFKSAVFDLKLQGSLINCQHLEVSVTIYFYSYLSLI